MLWAMSTRMLPPVGVIVPLFIIFKTLNLLDSHLGLHLLFQDIRRVVLGEDVRRRHGHGAACYDCRLGRAKAIGHGTDNGRG